MDVRRATDGAQGHRWVRLANRALSLKDPLKDPKCDAIGAGAWAKAPVFHRRFVEHPASASTRLLPVDILAP